ncbi:MAG: hypothetical protein GQ558_04990 [Thermoplasmata archaeon]|nr:hypothetical protein [Thermoplasmata archaeon]
MRPTPTDAASGGRGEGNVHSMERRGFLTGSMLVIAFCALVSAVCIYVMALSFWEGEATVLSTLLLGLYPAISVPIIAWEVQKILPVSFEIDGYSARMVRGGRVRREIPLDTDVKADILMRSERIVLDIKAFSSCCEEPLVKDRPERPMSLCGIILTKGDVTIACTHEGGWKLMDIGRIWEPFIDAVIDHDLEMGEELWRYFEFRREVETVADDGSSQSVLDKIAAWDF